MHKTIASCATAGLAVLVLITGAVAVSAQESRSDYSYFDDFSGDAAVSDSYWHSPFVDEIPDIYLYGLLCYVDGINERALGFFGGFEVNAEAYLHYMFPIDGPMAEIAAGQLEFEIPIAWDRPPQGLLVVTVFYEGAGGGFTETLTDPGVYEYDLIPTAPCERVYVHFLGDAVALDDLSVSLYATTPIEHETWGDIKALYR
jgi:hypothetical protein